MEPNTWPGLSKKQELEGEAGQSPHQPVPAELISRLTPSPSPVAVTGRSGGRQARLFISFQPQEEAGEKAVEEVIRWLGERHEVFVDRTEHQSGRATPTFGNGQLDKLNGDMAI